MNQYIPIVIPLFLGFCYISWHQSRSSFLGFLCKKIARRRQQQQRLEEVYERENDQRVEQRVEQIMGQMMGQMG